MAGTLSKAQADLFHDQGYLAVDGVLGDDNLVPLWREYSDLLDTVAHRLHAEGVGGVMGGRAAGILSGEYRGPVFEQARWEA